MMNDSDSGYVAGRISSCVAEFERTAEKLGAPSAIYKPRLSIDGNQWCALYGENLQDGVAGFGASPAMAMADFDKEWNKPLKRMMREEELL